MVADDGNGLLHKVWKNKIYISLILIILIAVVFGIYYYRQSNERGAELSQEELNFNALNGTYNQLSLEHLSLISANDDLNDRYANLSVRYNDLSNNQSNTYSEYQKLNDSVSKLQESGTVIALYYRTYKSGTTEMPNVTVEVTAYNVGDRRDDKLTIKCRVLFDGTLSLNEQSFTGVNPLEKRVAKWEFTDMTQVDKIWVE
jgi:hypothetical protein